MRRAIAICCVLGLVATAAADTKKVMVLKSEGRASAKVRSKIDGALVKLASGGPDQISPGEVTFADAAVMVGCEAEEARCKDEILATLAVDEVVASTVTPKPGGFEVHVRRISKGGGSRDATTFVPSDAPDKLEPIAPLFGTRPVGVEPPPPAIGPAPAEPGPVAAEPRVALAPSAPMQPEASQPEGRTGRKLQVAGMIGGGVLVAFSFGFWGRASDLQGEIDGAPSRTKTDIMRIEELEREGDGYASAGNLTFLLGAALAAVSTYYFIKKGRGARSMALGPAVFDHGAGLAFTLGGSP